MNLLKWFENLPRPAQLLLTVLATLLLVLAVDGVRGWDLSKKLFFPEINDVADVRFWSALVYGLVLGLGLPVAFLIWHWRDRNVRDQIENARKDINLKEFQDVQMRAAGALDEKLPQEAREQLQIAALHQLRGFLRGDYGESFKRPAFELLMAGHANAMRRYGTQKIVEWAKSQKNGDGMFVAVHDACDKIRAMIDPIARERISVLSTDWAIIRCLGFPLTRRNFDMLNLSDQDMSALDFRWSSFVGAGFHTTNMQDSNFSFCLFVGANLTHARCSNSDFSVAHMEGAELTQASFINGSLNSAKLRAANLESAKLYRTDIIDIDVNNCCFDDKTEFQSRWDNLTTDEQNAHRQKWIQGGAVNVSSFFQR